MRVPAVAPSLVRGVTVVVLAVAVVCQLVQRTDPTFALAYFTVDSALLLAVTLAASAVRPGMRLVEGLRGAATAGVVLSALVYATVIAPQSATGTWFAPWDDLPVRTATLLMHGVAPFLAVADLLLHDLLTGRVRDGAEVPVPALRTAVRWLVWPAAYLVVMTAVQVSGVGQIPYPFLRAESLAALLPVVGAAVVLCAATAGIGVLLVLLHRRVRLAPAQASPGRQPQGVTTPR